MSCFCSGVWAESAGTTPSPLNGRSWKAFTAAEASGTESAGASALPRLLSTVFMARCTCLPSSFSTLTELRASSCGAFKNSSGSLMRLPAHFTALINSGARMRPSPSVSMSSRVRASKVSPLVGQASATHSFQSS